MAGQVHPAPRGPRLERPKVDVGVTPEEWNVFTRRWDAFITGSGLDPNASSPQLFQCAGDTLGNSLLKTDPAIVSKPTTDVMAAMKLLAVIPIATGVIRAELVQMRQQRDEPFRSFAARVRGKAETCAYVTECICTRKVNFTDTIVRDVLLAGIADIDIRREVLGTDAILGRAVNDVIAIVVSKEMARNALPTTAAGISSFRREKATPTGTQSTPDRNRTAMCPDCKQTFSLFSEGARGWNTRPHRQCIKCYRAQRSSRRRDGSQHQASSTSETGVIFAQVSALHETGSNHQQPPMRTNNRHRRHRRRPRFKQTQSEPRSTQVHAHNIFSKGAWRRARFLNHPEVQLHMSVNNSDYRAFGRRCPTTAPTTITAMADTGAQSCLWSMDGFLAAGFSEEDLVPVHVDLVAANKSPITIDGAIIVRLQGVPLSDDKKSCATMVYVSKSAHGFYLSWEAMMDLGIVSHDFPSVGAAELQPPKAQRPLKEDHPAINAGCSAPPSNGTGPCSCPPRTVVPDRPDTLPFECTPANNGKMEDWLLQHFAASSFNTCPHRPLPCMTGPPVEIHLKEGAPPKAVHKPATVPIHWQEQVHSDLLRDEALGVIEKVPYGEPVLWCHRMVVTRKHDGTPRRTVDLSPLNKNCQRETFASESPFHLARRVPKGTWKTVSDAWNGYHSVPLRECDRHLTTFITPFGRWRYTRAPQGFLSSGDGYNRRFDAILSDFDRKERCVDDTIHYDTNLEAHWWRTIDFLIRVGQSGIVLNPGKFRFARREVDFAGFRISDEAIEPLPKYLDAIRGFPTPASTTDIRSWFGLVNQVANYAQLRDTMAPFKPFLSPKVRFEWTPALDEAFNTSKDAIVDAIRHGVEIFDPTKRTCLRPDWSCKGIGYFLSQKHCVCESRIPDCCDNGWRVTLAGSRFLSSAEQRYAAIEGEALAVAWGLEQSKYFTQGCNDLLVVTDHKPLVKIMGDRTLDEIPNSRLFRLKQRTLPWAFEIAHLPGKTNTAADATSRHPVSNFAELSSLTLHSAQDDAECAMTAAIRHETQNITALTWERIASETATDPVTRQLMDAIYTGFGDAHRTANDGLAAFWQYRESLHVLDGVILFSDRVVIPSSLRGEVLQTLHSAHQGVTSMESRARAIVFWPGMTKDIQSARERCTACNRNAPSQAALPPTLSPVPATPFESIYADFFDFGGCHYLVAGDRLSGWVEIFRAPHGTTQAGAQGLIAALRTLFATFGVPEDISSDGGPEFSASATADFLTRWGVRHRVSSAYFAQSNGRAEVAVKKAKRTLMDNVGPTGSLDNDGLLRALLQLRNTPDPDCNISPAEIVFGRPIRDAFSFVSRQNKFTNPSIRTTWREAWALKEDAMKARMPRSLEALNAHARPLAPLSLGNRVFLQNQHGPHPTKWDKSGTVVELRDHDQYWVKVDGSGRLSLRNRRFLRKFTPPTVAIEDSTHRSRRHMVDHGTSVPQRHAMAPQPQPASDQLEQGLTAVARPHTSTSMTEATVPTMDAPAQPVRDHTAAPAPLIPLTPSKTNLPPPDIPTAPITPVASGGVALARPHRQTIKPRHYVPETGKWQTR